LCRTGGRYWSASRIFWATCRLGGDALRPEVDAVLGVVVRVVLHQREQVVDRDLLPFGDLPRDPVPPQEAASST